VRDGYQDVKRLKEDPTFRAMRTRDDFKRLLIELEGMPSSRERENSLAGVLSLREAGT
jgi:hypothetical protein